MATVLSLLVVVCYVNVVFCSLALHEDLHQQKQVRYRIHRIACRSLHLNFASLPEKLHAKIVMKFAAYCVSVILEVQAAMLSVMYLDVCICLVKPESIQDSC